MTLTGYTMMCEQADPKQLVRRRVREGVGSPRRFSADRHRGVGARKLSSDWRVNAELPVPASFDAASKTVREGDVSTRMPCGPEQRELGRALDGRQALAFMRGILDELVADAQFASQN